MLVFCPLSEPGLQTWQDFPPCILQFILRFNAGIRQRIYCFIRGIHCARQISPIWVSPWCTGFRSLKEVHFIKNARFHEYAVSKFYNLRNAHGCFLAQCRIFLMSCIVYSAPCMAAEQRPRCRECHESPLAGNGAARELALWLGQHAPPAVSPAPGLWHPELPLRSLPFCLAGKQDTQYNLKY